MIKSNAKKFNHYKGKVIYMIKDNNWVTLWGNAISITHRKPENYAKNLTLRYPIKAMLTGNSIRITLDNFCGTEDVTISKVTVAPSDAKGNLTGAIQDVLFSCHATTINESNSDTKIINNNPGHQVIIPAGKSVVSEPVPFSAIRNEFFSVNIYLSDFTEMRSGVIITGPLSGGYFAIGDHTSSNSLPVNKSNKTDCYYFLSTIEIIPENSAHTIVCYGDSITAQDWPDYLIEDYLDTENTQTAVIRRAASGTRILRQYDNIVYDSYGLKGDIRFPHEANVNGGDILIIQHGINDIIHPVGVEVNKFRPWSDMPTIEDLIEGLTKYIQDARKMGYDKIYLGTLLPIRGWRTDAPFRDEMRCALNDWMRTTDLADGCIDFDLAVRDSKNPAAFAEGFDSGDHLHPSAKAYKAMADTAFHYLVMHTE